MWNGNCNLITKLKPYNRKFDYHSYVWFRYHRLFFGSLLKGVGNYEHLTFLILLNIN